MNPSEYENIARVERQHWWYRGMQAISLSLVAPDLGPQPLHILDAGCGPGGMLPALARIGSPIGVDIHPLALAVAQRRFAVAYPLLRASVTHLPFRSNDFDLITSFDVLYHRAVADDRAALSEFWRILKPGGTLLLRLPALEALRGSHDVVVHTQRRFTRPELRAKLLEAGYRIHRLTYANALLFPLVFLSRRLPRSRSETAASDVELPHPVVNRLLEAVLHVERLWLARFDFPIGVSLFAVACKPSH